MWFLFWYHNYPPQFSVSKTFQELFFQKFLNVHDLHWLLFVISMKVNTGLCIICFQFEWPEPDKNRSNKEAKIVYVFDYLPAGLFNRAQVNTCINFSSILFSFIISLNILLHELMHISLYTSIFLNFNVFNVYYTSVKNIYLLQNHLPRYKKSNNYFSFIG